MEQGSQANCLRNGRDQLHCEASARTMTVNDVVQAFAQDASSISRKKAGSPHVLKEDERPTSAKYSC